VQIKDVQAFKSVTANSLTRVAAPEAREGHLLRSGDVLMVARGTRNHSAVFTSEVPNAIAGSQLYVIRPQNEVLPAYLAWYLNQPDARQHITSNLAGSYVRFVPRGALDTLPIVLPPLGVQRKITEIHELCLQEQELLEAICMKRRELVDATLRWAVQREDYVGELAGKVGDNDEIN